MVLKRLSRYVLLLILFTTLIYGKSDYSLFINDSRVDLSTSPYQKENILYLPLRDLIDPLKSKLSYSRKNDVYTLLFNDKNQVSFKLYSKEIWMNGNRHFLTYPILYHSSRIYIPIESFMDVIGYTTSVEQNKITISTSKSFFKKPTFISKKPKYDIVSTTGESQEFSNKPIRLPKFEKDRPVSISFDDHIYDLAPHILYKKGILFVDILDFLQKEGASSEADTLGLTVSFQKKTYYFPFNSKRVTISDDSTSKSVSMSSSILQENNRFYFPLVSLINVLDYAVFWNSRERVIELLNKVNRVDLIEKDNKYYIKISLSNDSESYQSESIIQAEKITFSEGYFIDIPNATLNIPKKTMEGKNSHIQRIKLNQTDPTTVRMKVYFSSLSGIPSIVSYTDGLTFSINTVITEIKESISTNKSELTIKGSGPFKPHIIKENNKLIIDIPESINDLPNNVASSSKSYSQIRTSQFSYNPLSTRIVIDFNDSIPSYKTTEDGNTVTLTVDHPKESEKVVATPPQVKRIVKQEPTAQHWSKPKQKINFNHVLSGKIIVVDAGHGGRDPGAITQKRYYEKTYTLDVATRLQKLLLSKGAIVIMSRYNDSTVGLNTRTTLANKEKADLFVSIHFNSFNSASANGTETYYYKYKDKKLATHLQKQLSKDLKLKNNGVKRSRLYVLRHTKMTAALVEPGFLTNTKNFNQIKSPSFRQTLAESIYQGIINYYND